MNNARLDQKEREVLKEVAEAALNSLRWEFCLRNGFPYGAENALPKYRWCAHVRSDDEYAALSTHFGETPNAAVDAAMRAEVAHHAR